ncbi:MAG: tRNA-dihydrouridine synthase [Rickettsiales bacterium]|jgi:tRNA-dihydrouridine synthase B|nr:tRNA-dihydrouridine synthase [Rickettsiales bacterium]
MFAPIKSSEFVVFAAPMAGISDRPYRKVLRRLNPDLPLLTEMISCHSLVAAHKNCNRNFDDYAGEGLIGAQIFGADPKLMGEAARILADQGAKWIDINMGCPVPKVATRAGAGAFLMRDHKLAGQIIESVVQAAGIPVSIKTRLGWDDGHLDSGELIRIAANAGAAWATVHGRTRAQGYSGNADWNRIADIKRAAAIPIVFNGDIRGEKDIAAVAALGADGAMIGRAMLGNPRIFQKHATGSIKSEIAEHFQNVLEYYGDRAGVPLFRKHAAWYSAGMPGAAEFRTRVNQITDAGKMRVAIADFFV